MFAARGQGAVPARARQLIVAVSDTWNSTTGRLVYYDRVGKAWKPRIVKPIPVLFGRKGLAWGRGVLAHPPGSSAPVKKERDGRTPAGCFAIGGIYGYASSLPPGAKFPYRQVSKWDAWSDDPKSPLYNRHVVVDPKRGVPPWFQKARMRLGDFAYEWKIEIRHNSDPPVPGDGSAIFFHIRRGPDRPTAGCTTMAKPQLIAMIQWLRSEAAPHFVVLPKAEYGKLQRSWKLPPSP